MFASYEVATSFPSLTAIKGYDLDKSSDVPLMGHFYTSHKSISIFLLIQDLWTVPTRVNLWQKYPKVSVLRYSKNRNLKEFILV